MAPSTTLSISNTTSSTITTNIPTMGTKLFYDFGSVFGIDILYLIIGGITFVCILCCIIFVCACCKCKKRPPNQNHNKNHNKNEQSLPVEMTNGMELDWKYTIKNKSIDATKYKSSFKENNLSNEEEHKAFDRIINDRKTTVTHNPLQSVSPKSAQNPMSFSGDYNNYNMENENESVSTSSEEYKTEITESINNQTQNQNQNHNNMQSIQVVDTLTSIVNQANNKQKQVTHVLSLNKMDIMIPNISTQSIGASSAGFNREPSPGPASVASSQYH